MTTFEMLLAHFGGVPVIPLETAAQYWGYEADTLAKKADNGDVRVPYFRLDESQKAARLMMLSDIVSPGQDPSLDELAEKCVSLWGVDPNDHGFRRPSQVALKSYIRNIGNYVRASFSAPRRKQSALLDAWADLREQMRVHGKDRMIQRTFGVSKYAILDEVPPAQIKPAWVHRTMQALEGQHRKAFRSGIFVLDDLINDACFPDDGLPREASGLTRERKRPRP